MLTKTIETIIREKIINNFMKKKISTRIEQNRRKENVKAKRMNTIFEHMTTRIKRCMHRAFDALKTKMSTRIIITAVAFVHNRNGKRLIT